MVGGFSHRLNPINNMKKHYNGERNKAVWMNHSEAAVGLGITRHMLKGWVKEGVLQPHIIAKRIYYKAVDVDLLARQSRETTSSPWTDK